VAATALGQSIDVISSIPPAARRILRDGVLCHLASDAPAGPHLTPVVFVLDGGTLWLTTARSSVKARSWRRNPRVAGLVRAGEGAVSFRGTVRTYDALDLSSWPAATVAGPRLVRAATRFSMKNARFFAGYAVDANRVPFAWTPPGRVFASVRIDGGAVLVDGTVTEEWGFEKANGVHPATRFSPHTGRARSLDLGVPAQVRRAFGTSGGGTVALSAPDGAMTALPARWRRVGTENRFDAVAPVAFAALTGTRSGLPGALTIDRASSWRASEMMGILLRGAVEVFVPDAVRSGRRALRDTVIRAAGGDPAADVALLRLRPRRVVWWDGWTSGTVTR